MREFGAYKNNTRRSEYHAEPADCPAAIGPGSGSLAWVAARSNRETSLDSGTWIVGPATLRDPRNSAIIARPCSRADCRGIWRRVANPAPRQIWFGLSCACRNPICFQILHPTSRILSNGNACATSYAVRSTLGLVPARALLQTQDRLPRCEAGYVTGEAAETFSRWRCGAQRAVLSPTFSTEHKSSTDQARLFVTGRQLFP